MKLKNKGKIMDITKQDYINYCKKLEQEMKYYEDLKEEDKWLLFVNYIYIQCEYK